MKIKEKAISVILTITMIGMHLLTLGNAVIAVETEIERQNNKTNQANVEFDSYLAKGAHVQSFEVGQEGKLNLKIKVSNTGYLKNGTVLFNDANFKINTNNLKNEQVQSASENEIKLKQINNSNGVIVIEVPIDMLTGSEVSEKHFDKITTVEFTGTYIDGEGKEKSVVKEIKNEIKWQGKAEIELAGEISKYVPYQIGEEYGVMVQAKVQSGLKENSLPVVSSHIEVSIPEIKETKPSRITVVANSTKGTNGEEAIKFGEGNYKYNEETKKIEIDVKNEVKEGKISWNKEKDEYIVTYVYTGKEIYDYITEQLEKAGKTIKTEEEKKAGEKNENAIVGEIEIVGKIEAYNAEETILENSGKMSYSIETAKGTTSDIEISNTRELSKGYIYANYVKAEKEENKEKIENQKGTEYEVIYKAGIYDKEIIEEIIIQTQTEKYLDKDKTEKTSKKGDINSKKVKISEEVFKKILGEEGKIEINTTEGTNLGTINKDSKKDEKGNYVVDISEAKVNEILIKTSKPEAEGRIEITVEKEISAGQNYTEAEMKSFKQITLGVILKTNNIEEERNTNKIELKEPVSKAEISVSEEKKTLSTIVENKDVEIRVVLDTSSNKNALYKNPVLEIELPENIENLKVQDVDLLLDDELKIKETKIEEKNGKKVIVIKLEGSQSKYMDNGSPKEEQENVISKGANIVIKADITFKKLTPSKQANIVLYYTNENTDLYEKGYSTRSIASQVKGVATTGIDVVAPNGVATENSMSGYSENGSISNLGKDKQEQIIETYGQTKEVTIGGTIVNNCLNNIENVFVLGRTPNSGNKKIDGTEELGSNFTMKMTNKITTSGIDTSKVKVYYSTNGDATKDLLNSNNGWTETPSNLEEIKSYLIVIAGELESGTQIKYNYKTELPGNLSYGKSSYSMYKVYYDNKTAGATIGDTTVAGIIGLTTGEGPELEMKLSTNMETGPFYIYSEDGTYDEQNPAKVDSYYISDKFTNRFFLSIKNISKVDATNVKAKINLPKYTKLVSYDEIMGSFNVIDNLISVGTIKAGETKLVEYTLKAECNVSEEYFQQRLVSVNIQAENMQKAINSEEMPFVIIPTRYEQILNKTNTVETEVYSATKVIKYEINVAPSLEMTNFKLHIPLPKDVTIQNAYWEDGSKKNEEGITKTESEVIAHLSNLSLETKLFILEFKIGENTQEKFSTKVYTEADGVDKQYSNEQFVYVGKANMSGKQLEPVKRYVKEKEAFSYQFVVNTLEKGTHYNFIFEDNLPSGIKLLDADVKIECPVGQDYSDSERIIYDQDKVKITIPFLPANSKVTISLNVSGMLNSKEEDGKEIINKATIQSNQFGLVELNSVKNYLEYDQNAHKDPNSGGDEIENPTESHYKITGTAWVDVDKNGKKDENEELLSGIQVLLIYKNNSQIVKDVDNNVDKITYTDSNGKYEFDNLKTDEYLVIFLYDAGKYSITEYQKEGIGESYNSDAVNMKITLNGKQQYAGVTDTIKVVNSNVRDIDIGVYQAEKFDLKLDKYITKITRTTPTMGTTVYNYKNSKLAKIEVLKQNVNKSSIVVEYKIVVTNEGQIPGYVKKIIDYLPEDIKFSTDLNKDWYISDNNGTVYNTSLANEKIMPGESKEVSLIVSTTITDKNIGKIINNNAEIYESYNEQGIADFDSTEANKIETEDDMSKADIVLSIVTGKIVLYITITLAAITLLIVGVYEIRKRVLKKGGI